MAKINEIDITSLTFQEGSAPTTPASTKWKLYMKTDGLYYVDDAGTETGPLNTGGGSAYKTLLETLSPSAVASVTSSTFVTTYDDLVVEFELYCSTGGTSLRVQVGNTTVDTSSGSYQWSSVGGVASSSASDTAWTWTRAGIGGSNDYSTGIYTIRNYAATAERYYIGRWGYSGGAAARGGVDSGTFTPTASAINVIKIASDTANLTGEVRIYGITNA